MSIATTINRATLASPLPGVSPEQWRRFYAALDVQPCRAVSASGGFGSYDMRPRRLVELGLGQNLRGIRTRAGRQAWSCDFVPPFTLEKFLTNPVTQYQVLCLSVKGHHKELTSGEIARPEGISLAGALAVLHRGGKGALRAFPDLFDDTRRLYERAQGAF